MAPQSEPKFDLYISPKAKLPLTTYEHRGKSQGPLCPGALDIVVVYLFDGSNTESRTSFFSYTMNNVAEEAHTVWLDDLKLLADIISEYRTLCFGFDLGARQEKRVDYLQAADKVISSLKKVLLSRWLRRIAASRTHSPWVCRIADRFSDPHPHFNSSCIGIVYCQEPELDSDPSCGQILDGPPYKKVMSQMRWKCGTKQMCLSWEPGWWAASPATKLPKYQSSHETLDPIAFDVFVLIIKPVIASLDWLFSPSFTVKAAQSLGMFKPPVPREAMSLTLSFGFRDNSGQYLQMILRFILRVTETNSLLHAAEAGSVTQVQELIKSGVRLNISKNGYGMTALHLAVYSISDETDCGNIIEALCDQGRIAIDIKDNHGYIALSYGITEGRPEQVVRKLLKYGADVHILHHAENSPLAMAEAKGNLPANVIALMRNNPIVEGPQLSYIADHPATRTRLTNSVEIAKRFSFVLTELYVDTDSNTEVHLTRHKPVSEVVSGEGDFKTVFKPHREMMSNEKSTKLNCTCQ